MKKKAIMSKLNIKDYNRELEEILLSKSFSGDTKNLLLSMLYKLENAYEDYKKIKINVKSKKDLLEEILDIIEYNCDKIEIVKPKMKEEAILKNKANMVDNENKKIITYPNERAILDALYGLELENYIVKNGEGVVTKSLEQVLNIGSRNSLNEIIRDFDGWSWNINKNEIEDYTASLVYVLIVYVFGQKIIENKIIDIELWKKELQSLYKKDIGTKIYKLLLQISIILFIKENAQEKNKLIDNLQELNLQYNILNNKTEYIQKITDRKKQILKEINEIDKYINDDLALKKEYIKQNSILSQEERIFSLSDFSEKVQQRREELVKERELCTKKIEPKNYVKDKYALEDKISFIEEMQLENDSKETIEEILKLLLKNIYKALQVEINRIQTKKEILDMVCKIRYLKLFPVSLKQSVYDITKKEFEKLEKELLTKACNLKAITIFSQNISENYKILKDVLNTKIIDLEKAYIELKENDSKVSVVIYDENSIEGIVQIENIKEQIIKYNRKTKIFV